MQILGGRLRKRTATTVNKIVIKFTFRKVWTMVGGIRSRDWEKSSTWVNLRNRNRKSGEETKELNT